MIALDDYNLGTRITPNLIRHSDRSGIAGPTSSPPTFKTNLIAWLALRLQRDLRSLCVDDHCEHVERVAGEAKANRVRPPGA